MASKKDTDKSGVVIKWHLKQLCDNTPGARTGLAKALGISQSNVSQWTQLENVAVPSTIYLKRIAEYFDVSVDFLLSNSFTSTYLCAPPAGTYFSVYNKLIPLVDSEYIAIDDIKDDILRFMLSDRKRVVYDDNIPAEDKLKWQDDIANLFNYPIPEKCEVDIFQYIREKKAKEIGAERLMVSYSKMAALIADIQKNGIV